MENNKLQDNPCENCPDNKFCQVKCGYWKKYFRQKWRNLRKKFLGDTQIKRE